MGSRTYREARRRSRPGLDALETRVVLSTFKAGTLAQLESSIAAASNSSEPNTILVKPGTYVLPSSLKIQNAANLTIRPSSTGAINLVGSVVDRVLEIDGGNVTLSDVTVSSGGGVAMGAGILTKNASVSLKNVRVYNNVSNQSGAGIFAQGGTLNLSNSSVTNNRSSNNVVAFGGGVAAWGTNVSIASSTISENALFAVDLKTTNPELATGAGIFVHGGSLSVAGSTLNGNTIYAVTTGQRAAASGSAISTDQTPVTVTNSRFQYGSLTSMSFGITPVTQGSVFYTSGGSLKIANSTLLQNSPGGKASFSNPGATVTLTNVNLDGSKLNGTITG